MERNLVKIFKEDVTKRKKTRCYPVMSHQLSVLPSLQKIESRSTALSGCLETVSPLVGENYVS